MPVIYNGKLTGWGDLDRPVRTDRHPARILQFTQNLIFNQNSMNPSKPAQLIHPIRERKSVLTIDGAQDLDPVQPKVSQRLPLSASTRFRMECRYFLLKRFALPLCKCRLLLFRLLHKSRLKYLPFEIRFYFIKLRHKRLKAKLQRLRLIAQRNEERLDSTDRLTGREKGVNLINQGKHTGD